MAELEKILSGIDVISFFGLRQKEIENIVFDSRNVKKGSLFIAVKGTLTDGHDYINDAILSGASAVVCETLPDDYNRDICWIPVSYTHLTLPTN